MKNKTCCICGDRCSDKLMIEARKGKYYIFCPFHFNEYMTKPLKEVRLAIKFNKKLLKKQTFK